jgi:hypothetical protein
MLPDHQSHKMRNQYTMRTQHGLTCDSKNKLHSKESI